MIDLRQDPPSDQQSSDANEQEQPGTKHLHGPIQVAIVSQVAPPPSSNDKPKPCNSDKTPLWKKILEFLAIGLAFIAAGIYGGQLWVMKRQLKEMHSTTVSTEQAAYAACVSAQISHAALIQTQNGAEDAHQATVAAMYQGMAARETERALIEETIGAPQFHMGSGVGTPVKFHNIGKTSAYDFHARIRGVFLDKGDEPNLIYRKRLTSEISGGLDPDEIFPLTPGRTLVIDARLPDGSPFVPTAQDVADYTADKKVFFTFGRLTYQASFGGKHYLNFCRYQENFATGVSQNSGHEKCVRYNQSDKYSPSIQTPKTIPGIPEIKCVLPME